MPSNSHRAKVPHWIWRILGRSNPWWQGQLIAIICIFAATLVRFLLQPLLHDGVPFVTFFPAIIIVGFSGGALAGITAVILASAAALIWLPPLGSFPFDAPSWARIAAFWLTSSLVLVTVYLLRSIFEILIDSETRANRLANEMTHRVGNVLAVVSAISRQTARNSSTITEYEKAFESRLSALQNAQTLLNETPESPIGLKTLLLSILKPFSLRNLTLIGPVVHVPFDVAETLCLLVHELATNATKHGSLSIAEGQVMIDWHPEGEKVVLSWQELNGPPVVAPSRAGFGSRLLQTAFPPDTGQVALFYDKQGVRCTMKFNSENARN